MKEIHWDRDKLARLKVAYDAARVEGPDYVFGFEGERLLVSYARYLIEYLESVLP